MSTNMPEGGPEQPQVNTARSRPPGDSRLPDAGSDASLQTQIAFAQAAFNNIQELNRTMDQKANYLLSSVALLTAALGLVVSRAVAITAQNDWERLLKGASITFTLLYLLLAFAVIFVATSIYQARSARTTATTSAPGMLFPLMILDRFSAGGEADEKVYLDRLQTLRPDDILQDYSNQIIEVSIIYEAKQQKVNLCLDLFRWTGILWLLTMLVIVAVIVLLP
jgi:hypothetical protein